ncbi:hypothetical protein [Methanobacterium oryzae]|uniref:hypothetical protein n=1 Tax=Methanobacterium oryzae TaxID=69540 RepID=UPI003D236DA6
MIGGVIIKKEIRRDASYVTGVSFPAFLHGGDIFAAFILFFVIVIIALIFSLQSKKKKTHEQKDRRVSSIKRELKAVKEKASHEEADSWIKDRLDEDIDSLDSIILLNRK